MNKNLWRCLVLNRSKKIFGLVIALLFYSAVIAGVFYFAGYKIAYDQIENSATAHRSQTFYATISNIQDITLTVKGMEINDINFRGKFYFSVAEETMITWRYIDIPIKDLNVGDNISITFTGEILETYPAQITQVEVIQLLDDEK